MDKSSENANVFLCRFNPPRFNRWYIWGLSLTYGAILLYVGRNIAILLIMGIVMCLCPLLWELFIYRIRCKSFISITDNDIVVKYAGRRPKSYPLSEVEKVRVVNLDSTNLDNQMKHYTLSGAFSRGAGELIPDEGVLIFFKRAWIKSAFPIFFNPADPEAFAAYISARVDALHHQN